MKTIETRARPPKGPITPLEKRLVLQCNIAAQLKKSTRGSPRLDSPRLNVEPRGVADALEQRCLRRGHPHLAAAFETAKQGRAALRIEVSGDFVEQQNRRLAPAI